uniref:Uncharacterized protein n=1 Tax=Plectus sambesii TaxID=2011161 RepID=A0A914XJI8_9BILA
MNTSIDLRSDWSIESFPTDRRISEVDGPLTADEIEVIEKIYQLFLGGHPISERELYAFLACLSRYVGFDGHGVWTRIAKMVNRQENRPREYADGNDLFQRVKKAFPRIAKK